MCQVLPLFQFGKRRLKSVEACFEAGLTEGCRVKLTKTEPSKPSTSKLEPETWQNFDKDVSLIFRSFTFDNLNFALSSSQLKRNVGQ